MQPLAGDASPAAQRPWRAEWGADAAAAAARGGSAEERRRLWKLAIKLPMYSVGVMPVLVGAAAAYAEAGALAWGRLAALLAGAVCVIAWLNLSNDAFDATTGVDRTKPESVVNLTGSRRRVLLAANAFLAAGAWLLGGAVAAAGGGAGGAAGAMLGAAVVCGYLYQGPPFRFSYKGLGEPLCFVAFGPLATPAFYLLLAPAAAAAKAAAATGGVAGGGAAVVAAAAAAAARLPPPVWAAAALVGLTTAVILFCSHFHQIEGDRAAGKLSPLVRIGAANGTRALALAVAAAYMGAVTAAATGALPAGAAVVAGAASLPAARALVGFAQQHHTDAAAVAPLKRYAIKWHCAFGAALAAGLAAAGGAPAA